MLYSHNRENEKLQQFSVLLDQALKGDPEYASVVNDVILETHQYTSGQKDLYHVNKDLMNIIILLSDVDRGYFEQLQENPAEYDRQTYSKVKEIINSQND